MDEEKAAAYYDELSRKGGGAARFKQGLGFSAASSSNDAVPSVGSAIPSAASFHSKFVRESIPSKNEEAEKKHQLHTIQNKLKKKPKEEDKPISASRVSRDRHSDSKHSRPSREIHSRGRSRSRSRERYSKRRSRSKDREKDSSLRSRNDSSNRRHRSRSRSRERAKERRRRSSSGSDEERDKRRKNRNVSPPDARSEKKSKAGKGRKECVDYATVIDGYDKMTPAERVKAKMKLQLSETAERDEANGMGSGWERFDFNKDAPLDDEEIEVAEDDAVLVKHIGQTFRFSTMEARREDRIKAAHDEAIFGCSRHDENVGGTASHPPFNDADDEIEKENVKTPESDPLTNLISDQVMAMQGVSWRDRARRS
ncbi:unnamed protein product [Cuscuta epithymum]|uniref:Uncharacterized protein n=1 Tax=Cuscuta epithymum TaxID=186058 RepID=A0AAV0CEU1_9ASTE|nr:unnamed protein product [Cuscuta epithymum]